jgi:quinol monooxygenase YgiN
MNITLLVRIAGKKGHGKDLTQLIRPMPEDNNVEGCLGMDVFMNASNPDDILLLERWSSVQAHQKFISGIRDAGGLDEMLKHADSVERKYYIETKE